MAANRRKHVEGNIAYFMYALYVKTVDFKHWILTGYKKYPGLVLS